MTTQPEALRLADELEDMTCLWSPSVNRARVDKATAELRRLHEENGRLRIVAEMSTLLLDQRSALLELVVEMDRHGGAEGWSEDLRVKINAAIKAAEEGK